MKQRCINAKLTIAVLALTTLLIFTALPLASITASTASRLSPGSPWDIAMRMNRHEGAISPDLSSTNAWTTGGPYAADILAMAVSPDYANDHTVFVIHNTDWDEPTIVLKTNDGGVSWNEIYNPEWFRPTSVALSPDFASDQTIFITADTALYSSLDGGLSWQRREFPGIPGSTGSPVEVIFSPDYE